MQHSTNCTPGYDPFLHKFCSKCGISDHHEFECARYYLYNPDRCKLCATLYHYTSDFKAITKKLGYKPTELQAELVSLLIILEIKYHISPPNLAQAQTSDESCGTKRKHILHTTSREKIPKYILYEDILFRAFPSEGPRATIYVLCIPTSLMWLLMSMVKTKNKTQSKTKTLKSFMDSFFHPEAKEAVNQFFKHYGL
jgi:hypothetical protein